MKRNQHEEDNCGHWEYVIPCEFVSADAVLNYGVVPSYFGTTIRRLRFTLAMSQECVEDMSALEDSAYPEGDYHRRTHRTRGDVDVDRLSEMIASRRAQFTGNRFDERSNDLHEHDASVSGAGYGLLNDSEVPVFEVYEDNDPAESEDTFQRVVRKSSNSIFPIDLRRIGTGVGSDKVVESKFEDDADKENQDPIVEGVVTYTRSPLPEWYPRRPLQDITNVLVSDPVLFTYSLLSNSNSMPTHSNDSSASSHLSVSISVRSPFVESFELSLDKDLHVSSSLVNGQFIRNQYNIVSIRWMSLTLRSVTG